MSAFISCYKKTLQRKSNYSLFTSLHKISMDNSYIHHSSHVWTWYNIFDGHFIHKTSSLSACYRISFFGYWSIYLILLACSCFHKWPMSHKCFAHISPKSIYFWINWFLDKEATTKQGDISLSNMYSSPPF